MTVEQFRQKCAEALTGWSVEPDSVQIVGEAAVATVRGPAGVRWAVFAPNRRSMPAGLTGEWFESEAGYCMLVAPERAKVPALQRAFPWTRPRELPESGLVVELSGSTRAAEAGLLRSARSFQVFPVLGAIPEAELDAGLLVPPVVGVFAAGVRGGYAVSAAGITSVAGALRALEAGFTVLKLDWPAWCRNGNDGVRTVSDELTAQYAGKSFVIGERAVRLAPELVSGTLPQVLTGLIALEQLRRRIPEKQWAALSLVLRLAEPGGFAGVEEHLLLARELVRRGTPVAGVDPGTCPPPLLRQHGEIAVLYGGHRVAVPPESAAVPSEGSARYVSCPPFPDHWTEREIEQYFTRCFVGWGVPRRSGTPLESVKHG